MNVLEKVAQAKQEIEERLSRGGFGARAAFWKPSNGENQIRIMPSWLNPNNDPTLTLDEKLQTFEGQFWREVAQHWNINEEDAGPSLCPKRTPGLGDDCPICEFVDELKRDKSDVRAQELVKKIRAKTAFYYNVVSQKDPVYTAADVAEFKKGNPTEECPFKVGDVKVQIYAAPITVHDSILGMIHANKQDVTRLDTGRLVIINKTGTGITTRYQVMPHFNQSAFDLQGTTLPALHQQGFVMTYEKMLEKLNSGVGGDFSAALPETTPAPQQLTTGRGRVDDGVDLAEKLRAAINQ